MANDTLLRRVAAAELVAASPTVLDDETLGIARNILEDLRAGGVRALRRHAERLGDLRAGEPLILEREALLAARDAIPTGDRELLERVAARVAHFARAQRESLRALELSIPGGRAGHDILPVARAGCYAPGGRHPLPSSVLMTAVTARVAGVDEIVVASPRPAPITLAAAAVAGADRLLACGGAQAVGALAYGIEGLAPCEVVVGPGNRFVTAAKKLVAGEVRIDFLAGPSELLVLADDSADPATIAADLLAQAEHDPDARPLLVLLRAEVLAEAVERELLAQLAVLPTREVARSALRNGVVVHVDDDEAAVQVCNRLAPEHLQVLTRDPGRFRALLRHCGGLFLGPASAEVLGDYGIGPNHVLPTGGASRAHGGLSVLQFLRLRGWLELDSVDPGTCADAVRLAELEGLAGHAAAARRRGG